MVFHLRRLDVTRCPLARVRTGKVDGNIAMRCCNKEMPRCGLDFKSEEFERLPSFAECAWAKSVDEAGDSC
jgi:hypothetical protein